VVPCAIISPAIPC